MKVSNGLHWVGLTGIWDWGAGNWNMMGGTDWNMGLGHGNGLYSRG